MAKQIAHNMKDVFVDKKRFKGYSLYQIWLLIINTSYNRANFSI